MQEHLSELPRQKFPYSPEHIALLDSIEDLRQKGESVMERFMVMYESSSEAEMRCIERAGEDYQAAADEAKNSGEPKPDLASFLEGREIPEDFKTTMVSVDAIAAELEDLEAELERYASEKSEEVLGLAVQLTNGLDYDKVVALSLGDDDQNSHADSDHAHPDPAYLLDDVSKVIGIRALLEKRKQDLDYSRLESLEDFLAKCGRTWEEAGLLGATGGEASEEHFEAPIAECISDMETRIANVNSLRFKYKCFDSEYTTQIQAFESFLYKIRADDPFESIDELYARYGVVYNEGLSTAVRRRLTRAFNELPAEDFDTDASTDSYAAFVEKARGIDATEAIENIEIPGSFDKLPFEYSKAELQRYLLMNVPALALAAVGSVEIRSLTKEEDEDDMVAGFHDHSNEFGASKIVISDTTLYEIYDLIHEVYNGHNDAEWLAQAMAKKSFEDTVVHEFAHAFHHWLPIAALSRWEGQRETDPARVTSYVEKRFEQNHRYRFREDFAETMRLFVNEPVELMRLSPVRYEAMRQMFDDFMPRYNGLTKILEGLRIAFARTNRPEVAPETDPS